MKYKVKVQVGADIPGVGLTRKNKEFAVEADTLAEALTKVEAEYSKLGLQAPESYAAWQVAVTRAPEAEAPANPGEPVPAEA